MNVPLSANAIIYQGKEMISIWHEGKNKVIEAPIKPYFYSNKKDISIPANISEVRAKKLSNYQVGKFFKYEFLTREKLVRYRDRIPAFESNIPFIIRNVIDIENLFTKFSHTNDLKFLFLDIEQYTKPEDMFPTYEDRIISISWCGNDRFVKTVFLNKETTSDKKLLEKFIEEYQKIDPDVLVLFNKRYDIPTILHRCMRTNINTGAFSKNGVKPYIGGKDDVSIEGVVIYDIYDSARADQSLFGNVPNKGLKAVSNYFGFETKNKEFDMKNIHQLVGTKELIRYNKDDVKRLFLLFDIYWDNIEFNANDLKIPLNVALDLNITDLGLLIMGKEYKRMNVIANGTNKERWPEIFNDKKGGNFEGALIDIFKTGLFEPVYKVDYSSLYPSIMASFNLSPDTTTLLNFESYGKFWIEEEERWFIYHIPDKILGKSIVLQVSKKPGFCSELVKRFLNERAEYKKKWKETGDKKYRAMSDNRKVKANGGVYGIQGSPNHAFGFVPIAIATTGIGRECAQLLIDVAEELYPDSPIEIDTDGLYFTTNNFDKDVLLKLFNKKLNEKFKKDLQLSVDIDEYEKGFFYKAKNYILQRDGTVIYHGAAMKASSKNLLSKNMIKELGEAKLNEKPTKDIIDHYSKMDFPIQHFAMSVTMGMHMHQYKNLNAIAPRLAKQAEKQLGLKPEMGRQYHYVKTDNEYTLLELANIKYIDRGYYKTQIERIVKMFDVELPLDGGLDKWL